MNRKILGLLSLILVLAPTLLFAADGGLVPENTARLESSTGAAFVFWMFSFLVIGGAVFVITRANLVTAVMGMVGTFFCIAVVYTMLYAHFLAAIQVLVYAGAIMVLFVFVVMVLNRPETDPWSLKGRVGKALSGLGLAYLGYRMISVLWAVRPANPAADLAPGKLVDGSDWGSTDAMGQVLFGQYLFPFEAVSIVLMVAVVGAIAVARPELERSAQAEDDGGAA